MQKLKEYSGTEAFTTTTRNDIKIYGRTTTVSVNASRKDFLNNKIVEFLTECGVDVKYQDGFLWISGVPFHFYFTGSLNYFNVATPYRETIFAGSTSRYVVLSGNIYKFKMSFIGEKTRFLFRISSYGSTWDSKTFFMIFLKGKNIINNNDAFLYYCMSSTSERSCYAVEFENNLLKEVNHCGGNPLTFNDFQTYEEDYVENPGKFPLVKQLAGVYKVDEVYQFPLECGITNPGGLAEVQNIVEIAGSKFFVCYGTYIFYGLIKVDS